MKHFFIITCLYIAFSGCLFAQENIENDETLQDLEKKISKEQNYLNKITYLKKLAEAQSEKKQYKAVIKTFKILVDLATAEKDTFNIVEGLSLLTSYSSAENQENDVLEYTAKTELLLDKNDENNYEKLASAFHDRAMAYKRLQRYNKALENLFKSNALLKKIKNKDSKIAFKLIVSHLSISHIYLNIDDYEKALENIDRVLELAKKLTDGQHKSQLIALHYLIKGEILIDQNRLEESLPNINKALNLFTLNKDSLNIANTLDEIGNFHLKKKDFKEALKYFKQGLRIKKKVNRLDLISIGYRSISNCYKSINKNELALKYIDSALTVAKDNNYNVQKIKSLVKKAEIYKSKKDYNLAIEIFHCVLELGEGDTKDKNYQETIIDAHKALSTLYKEKGDIKKSNSSLNTYIEIKEKLIEKKADTKTKILEVEYNYRNLITELDNKQMALALAETKQEKLKVTICFIYGSAFFIFLFIAITVLRQRKHEKTKRLVLESKQELLKVKKEALDREVEYNTKNLTDFALQINEKNTLLEKIKNQLKQIKPANNYSKCALSDAILFINDDIDRDKEKIQLYSKVDENNDDFKSKMSENFENLTDRERKIATMIRIGKTSKQIGIQLNISVASVDNYRYIIRKKMNVPKGKSLGTFIKGL